MSNAIVRIVSKSSLASLAHAEQLAQLGFRAVPKTSLLTLEDGRAVMYVGVAEKGSDRFMIAGAVAWKCARHARYTALTFETVTEAAQARDVALGALLASYTYRTTKSADPESPVIVLETITIAGFEDAVQEAKSIASGMNYARELGNLPGNIATPTYLAAQAEALAAEYGFAVEVFDFAQIEAMGMGAFVSVAKGSEQPAKLIVLRNTSATPKPPILLVGKGLTFDTGGISIKPSASMEEMKFDMCGGAAVLGTFKAMGIAGIQADVVGIIPATENMPGGRASKPGDIVTAYNGKTIEVINTDAEGRLILCDALAYGIKRFSPSMVVDIATLTGACVVALGSHAIGVISNTDEMAQHVRTLAAEYHEALWQMPAFAEYDEQLKSEYADMQNVGGKEAGTITAGLFLQRFIPEGTRWMHLDVAGTAWDVKKEYFEGKGATGSGVRAFYALIKQEIH
ncbi:leucyl aminopeptidase [Chrysiogenes arsenatis]|uniref:leucyl aminopeptidase n=1 Tax=Chrysiogenes arsenatis TaxID=309797 RepID=UPI000426582D|nr:leucyl aminopeptidase [Chrysiogenes arsenatis]